MNTKELILNKIKEEGLKAFSTSDFLDINAYKNISKALEQLEDDKTIIRARRGIYYIANYDNELGMFEAPNMKDIADAIARQFNWTISPSGNYALNILGLSTQVPSKYVFVSNGPYNKYSVGKSIIEFKHTTSKELGDYPYGVLLAIQALKKIGKDHIDDNIRFKIRQNLSQQERLFIINGKNVITSWILQELKRIAEEKDV